MSNRRGILIPIVIISLVMIIATMIGSEIGSLTAADKSNTKGLRIGKIRFTNPLLTYNTKGQSEKPAYEKIKKELNTVITKTQGNKNVYDVSLYYKELNNDEWFGIKENDLYHPASLYKLPLYMTYLKLLQQKKLFAEQEIAFNDESELNYISQTIKPEKTLIKGNKYSLDTLLNTMIVNSANDSLYLLLNHIDLDTQNKIFDDLNIKRPTTPEFDYMISPHTYSLFYQVLYNGTYLDSEHSEKALELLSKTQFKRGIAYGIPANFAVSHKFGEREFNENDPKEFHDCGIVYTKNPYLLCIMTRGKDFASLLKTIENISQKIYVGLAH